MMRAWVAAALLSSCTFRDGTGTTPPDPDAAVDAPVATWWNPSFTSRFQLSIHTTSPLPVGFQLGGAFDLDGAPCSTTAGNRNSVRVVHQPVGGSATELDRVIDEVGSSVTVWFKLPASIDAGTTSSDYYVYCTNPSATAAPQDPKTIFDLYDSFATTIDPGLWATAGGPSAANGLLLPTGAAIHSLVAFPVNTGVDYALTASSNALANEGFFAGFEASPNPPGDFTPGTAPFMLWWGGNNGKANNDIHVAESLPPVATNYGSSVALDGMTHIFGVEIFVDQARFSIADQVSLTEVYGSTTLSQMLNIRVQNNTSSGAITVSWVRTRLTASSYPSISRGPAETYMP